MVLPARNCLISLCFVLICMHVINISNHYRRKHASLRPNYQSNWWWIRLVGMDVLKRKYLADLFDSLLAM